MVKLFQVKCSTGDLACMKLEICRYCQAGYGFVSTIEWSMYIFKLFHSSNKHIIINTQYRVRVYPVYQDFGFLEPFGLP